MVVLLSDKTFNHKISWNDGTMILIYKGNCNDVASILVSILCEIWIDWPAKLDLHMTETTSQKGNEIFLVLMKRVFEVF